MNLTQKQQDFTDLFNSLGEWPNRFNYLMALADELPPMPAHMVIPENKIAGCISQTYFCCTYIDEVAHIYGKSNACIPAGLISVIKEIFQGCTRQDIYDTVINFHFQTDLIHHLTPARAGALTQMLYRLL